MSEVVTVSSPKPVGMITIRMDFAAPGAHAILLAATGIVMPGPGRVTFLGERALAWMSPDEAMLFLPLGEVVATVRTLSETFADLHHLVVDVSDARHIFRLRGAGAREVLAKGAPVDLSPAAFRPGDFRRTRLGQIAAAFWLREDGAFDVMCFRSVAEFVGLWLETAARPGSLPGVFAARS